jgi:hypothetical protein
VDRLTDTEARELSAAWCEAAPDALPPEATEVAAECGNLPLALALCGALARDGLDLRLITSMDRGE